MAKPAPEAVKWSQRRGAPPTDGETPVLTPPAENYLIAIQTLEDEGQPSLLARVAEQVGVTAPTALETLRRLARDGYVTLSDRQIALTDKGHATAKSLQRRHRLIERWLVDVLGLDWGAAHEEAHRLEHALSESVAERLAESMGFPETCPHGNPIRDLAASPLAPSARLVDAPHGTPLVLQRISELAEDNLELLHFYEENGLRPGARLVATRQGPLDAPFLLEVEGRPVALGREVAWYLWVEVSGEGVPATR